MKLLTPMLQCFTVMDDIWAALWFLCRKNDVDYRKYSSKDLWAHAFISTSVTVMLWNVLLKQQVSKCKSIWRSEARPAACDHQLPSNRVRASFISDSQLVDLCSYLFGSDFCIFNISHLRAVVSINSCIGRRNSATSNICEQQPCRRPDKVSGAE